MYSVEKIDQCKEIIVDLFKENLNEIILFGSYSKNTANDNSDLDIAIITLWNLDRKSKLNKLNQLWQTTSEQDLKADFIIKTFNDFNLEKELPTISRVIYREGKTLWKKN